MRTDEYRFQSNFAKKHFNAGREKGRAEAVAYFVLNAIQNRGFAILPAARKRIVDCQGQGTLTRWVVRSATAESLKQIFDEDYSPLRLSYALQLQSVGKYISHVVPA